MNADRLLVLYERIADAPDALPRLRRFILDLAVRGKLVPQDPNDEPASELLRQIEEEKRRLGIQHTVSPLTPDEIPFALPQGWSWSRVGQVCTKTGSGSTPRGGKEVYKTSGVPFLRSQNVYDDGLRLDDVVFIDAETHARMSGTAVKPKDLLLNITGGSMGRCCRVPDEFRDGNVSQHVAIIRVALPELTDFLHQLILAPYFQAFIFDEQTGAGRGGLPKNRMDRIAVALPPLAEQRRIVAKVDELMKLCDRLELARKEREATRDQLAAASCARLNIPDPETFHHDARFALDALPALTARADQIKQFRQTILNLAVRGKLVPQDPNDGLAPLFEQHTSLVSDPPFEIPKSWRWACLSTLGKLKGGGTPSKACEEYWNGNIPWVSPKDMKVDYISAAQMSISAAAVEGSSANLIEAGSVLFVVRGMILAHSFPVAVARCALTINQDMKALTLKKPEMADYILRALKGLKPEMLSRVQRSSHGTCRLEGSDYNDFLVPVPPLAEQHRIVVKVDQLMKVCDRLEDSLTKGDNARRRLLDALLAEALAPVSGREMQAAE